MIANIKRIVSDTEATLGAMYVDNQFLCFTLEPEWKNNVPFYSCIPTGKYICKKVYDRKLNKNYKIAVTFEVCSVPLRSGILFHMGNTHKDTQGCILVGLSSIKVPDKQPYISDSTMGFKAFLAKFKDIDEFTLVIE